MSEPLKQYKCNKTGTTIFAYLSDIQKENWNSVAFIDKKSDGPYEFEPVLSAGTATVHAEAGFMVSESMLDSVETAHEYEGTLNALARNEKEEKEATRHMRER